MGFEMPSREKVSRDVFVKDRTVHIIKQLCRPEGSEQPIWQHDIGQSERGKEHFWEAAGVDYRAIRSNAF